MRAAGRRRSVGPRYRRMLWKRRTTGAADAFFPRIRCPIGLRHRWSLESCLCDSSPATTQRLTNDHGQVEKSKMPKCIVDYCHNYAGMRKNYANVILHGFPTTLDRIKTWLKSLEQGGQVFKNLDEMAAKIHEGKKHDSYRICSEHFSQQCYMVNGDKKVLNKNAVPTILTPCVTEPSCIHRPEPLSRQPKEFTKRRANEDSSRYSQETKLFCKDNPTSVKSGRELTGIVINLTLEIIYLLTGELAILIFVLLAGSSGTQMERLRTCWRLCAEHAAASGPRVGMSAGPVMTSRSHDRDVMAGPSRIASLAPEPATCTAEDSAHVGG
ncbi:unnamed protein product [Ranitomeya imitator]|uniref:THAP-type domain-containing protein n=1 Tax=Ranitomeya imitator TaxID=111125 RepID=A0ABN9LWA5_9NEOB|nr:unnamed protein product [Ranitomeya imitator]